MENCIDEIIELFKEAFGAITDIIEEITGKLEVFIKYDEREPYEEPERTPYLMPAAPEVFPPARRRQKNRAFFSPKNNAGNECQRKRGVYHELFQGSGRPSTFGAYA